jgi:hypothetical protein
LLSQPSHLDQRPRIQLLLTTVDPNFLSGHDSCSIRVSLCLTGEMLVEVEGEVEGEGDVEGEVEGEGEVEVEIPVRISSSQH